MILETRGFHSAPREAMSSSAKTGIAAKTQRRKSDPKKR
jgi:hypothetical protein